MLVGMRKGKKRAIHTPGEVVEVSNQIKIKKLFSEEMLCIFDSDKKIEKGLVYIVIVPSEESMGNLKLTEIKTAGGVLTAFFESDRDTKVEICLDDRGRAKNLKVGKKYSISIFPWKKFFESYERSSIPAGKWGRSEPDEIAKARIKNFQELADVKNNYKIFDAATGIKEYLKYFDKCFLACGNISISMLRRTKEWLGKGAFVLYDVEAGVSFKEKSFDAIICDALLEYTVNPHEVLKKLAGILKNDGKFLLLEPIKALSDVDKFYPQDLWELALWRPFHDKNFNSTAFEKTLKNLGLGVIERREMYFKYPIYKEELFRQDVVKIERF